MSQAELRTTNARRLRQDWTKAEARLWLSLRNRKLDGGQHSEQVDYDTARTAVLEQAGFHVLRFWNHHVMTEIDGVLHEISTVLRAARP